MAAKVSCDGADRIVIKIHACNPELSSLRPLHDPLVVVSNRLREMNQGLSSHLSYIGRWLCRQPQANYEPSVPRQHQENDSVYLEQLAAGRRSSRGVLVLLGELERS